MPNAVIFFLQIVRALHLLVAHCSLRRACLSLLSAPPAECFRGLVGEVDARIAALLGGERDARIAALFAVENLQTFVFFAGSPPSESLGLPAASKERVNV